MRPSLTASDWPSAVGYWNSPDRLLHQGIGLDGSAPDLWQAHPEERKDAPPVKADKAE